jgi:predicted sugar kinase
MNDASLSQEERFKRLKKMDEQYPTLTELTNLMERARKAWVRRDEKITSTGVLSLMPDKIERQIKECLESIVAAQNPEAYASVVIQVDSVFTEIKKILGLTVFE